MQNDSIRNIVVNKNKKIKFPIRFGLVQAESNSISQSELVIRNVINNLNQSFAPVNFLFYLEQIDIIKTDLSLEDLSSNVDNIYDRFSEQNDHDDMITIYVLNHRDEFCNIQSESISCSRTVGFSYILSERTNNIVVSQFDLKDPKIIAHELGHFFGLFHTFEEFNFGKDQFDSDKCQDVGDRMCDTPPDPGIVFEIYVNYSTCEMIGLKDTIGNEYKPLLENYMSYYKPCYLRKYSFTEDQIMFMQIASMTPIRKRLSRT